MSAEPKSSGGQSRADLRENFDKAFSLEELALLCDDLGVDPEDIPGREEGKDYWISQIILYFERRNRIGDLLARAAKERPNIDWRYTPEPEPDEPPPQDDKPKAHIGPFDVRTLPIYLGVLLLAGVVVYLARPGSWRATPPTAASTAVPVTPTAQAKATGLFNVVVADFGQMDDAGQVHPSEDGEKIAQTLYDSLKTEFDNLPVGVTQDFKPTVRFGNLGLVSDDTAAQDLAYRLGADAVVYGNLTPGQPASSLIPRFYVSRLRSEADELVGSYDLGAPIPLRLPLDNDSLRGLNLTLTYRQKLLSGFALGLLYDLLGRPQQALDILTNTLNSVKGRPEEEGREVLLFFIGRENLLLQRPTDAEAAFNQARDVNPDYARAYIGLGGVAFQRAQAQTPEERLTTSTWLDQSLANYQTALDKAQITRDTQVIAKARLGLGYAHRLRGEAYLRQNFGDADKEFAQAIDLIRGVLPELSGQYRLLGQGFSALGAAYEEAAFSRQAQNDKAGARDLYQKAQDAYGQCVMQGQASSQDLILKSIVRDLCLPGQQGVAQALRGLE